MFCGLVTILASLIIFSFNIIFDNLTTDAQNRDQINVENNQNSNNEKISKILDISFKSGVITEFLGATFLVIYRLTLNEARRHTESLERTNTVGIAMLILDTATLESQRDTVSKNEEKLLDTKINIATLLIEKQKTPEITQFTKTEKPKEN